MSTAELNRVAFEAESSESTVTEYSDSEPESDVTDEPYDPDRGYQVDAIKWARWRSKNERSDGTQGWHYGIMWRGYLKAASESEEPVDVIERAPKPEDDIVRQTFDLEKYPFLALSGKARQPKKPPTEFLKHVFATPPPLMKHWLRQCIGREYRVYRGRQEWEAAHPMQTVPKRWSDYHVHHNKNTKAKNRKILNRAQERLKASNSLASASYDSDRKKKRGKERERGSSSRAKSVVASSSKQSPTRERSDSPLDPVCDSDFEDKVPMSRSPPIRDKEEGSPVIVKKKKLNKIRISSPPPPPPAVPKSAASASATTEAFASWLALAPAQPKLSGARLANLGKIPKRTESSLDSTTIPPPYPTPTIPDLTVQAPTPQQGPSLQPISGIFPLSPSPSQGIPIPAFPQSHGTHSQGSSSAGPSQAEPLFLPGDDSFKEEIAGDRSESMPLPLSAIPTSTATVADLARAPSPVIHAGPSQVSTVASNAARIFSPRLPTPSEVTTRQPSPLTGPSGIQPAAQSPMSIFGSPESKAVPTTAPVSAPGPGGSRGASPAELSTDDRRPVMAKGISGIVPNLSLAPSTMPTLPAASASSPLLPPTPATATQLPTSTSVPASPANPPKRDLASIPKYQQPKRVKLIDEPINPSSQPVLRRNFPSYKPVDNKPSYAFSGPSSASGSRLMRSPLSANSMRTPLDPQVMRSPMDFRGGISPIDGGQTPPHGQLPQSSSNAVYQPRSASIDATRPVRPFPPPQQTFQPPTQPRNFPARTPLPPQNAQFHPNRAPPIGPASMQQYGPSSMISPPIPQGSLPPVVAPTYNARADPRRRPAGAAATTGTAVGSGQPMTPLSNPNATPNPYGQASPRSPEGPNRKVSTSSATSSREPLMDLRIRVPTRHPVDLSGFDVKLLEGARLCPSMMDVLRPLETTKTELLFEAIDSTCIEGSERCGARCMEWAKLAHMDTRGPAGQAEWAKLKGLTKTGKAYVAYTDFPHERISAHLAIVIAAPQSIDLSKVGLGSWKSDELSLILAILVLPLTSQEPPLLPNPVRPSFEIQDFKPPFMPSSIPLLDSFGITDDFTRSLSGRRVSRYPAEEKPIDHLFSTFIEGCKRVGALGTNDGPPEVVMTCNQKMARTLRSTTLRDAIRRRTVFYTAGPALQLYPSQWGLKRIWESGGLVTFSPTFILRSPDKFAEIMKMVRTTSKWAAYVIPTVLEWAEASWNDPARCPEPTKSFETLTRSLFLDQNLLQFSGSAASSGGGLAVTCAPPIIHQTEACIRWTSWLPKICEQRDFRSLVDLCQSFSGDFASEPKPRELDLMDIESAQIDDLSAMRARPHLLPYRRYTYIGEVSLDAKTKERLGATIEFVDADNFAAIFSGAV